MIRRRMIQRLDRSGCSSRLHLSFQWDRVLWEDNAGPEDHRHHQSEEAECKRRYAMFQLRTSAKTSNEATSMIVSNVLETVPEDAQGSFQKPNSLKRVVQRARCDANLPNLSVETRDQLPALYNLFKTKTSEDMVKWDSGKETNRIVIMTTQKNLDWLQNCNHWYCDGTFKCRPMLFDQVFIINGVRGEGAEAVSFPLVFCLTPNRTKDTYTRILDKLKELQPSLAPATVMTDFEKAELGAFKDCFPDSIQRGCFFHFQQSNQRHIAGWLTFVLSTYFSSCNLIS